MRVLLPLATVAQSFAATSGVLPVARGPHRVLVVEDDPIVRMSLVRSMYHSHNDHGRGSYWMFTGYPYAGSNRRTDSR